MGEHKATIRWKNSGPDFSKGKYSREHTWSFDGGMTIQASPSPASVPAPYSNPAHLDPEEAFVASLSSCHMLTFLFVAYRAGFCAASYEDNAVGFLEKNESGVPWVARVVLRPKIVFEGDKVPSQSDLDRLHDLSHEQCYIANSVKTTVTVENQ